LTAVLANRCAKGEVIEAADLQEIGRLLGDSLNELRLIARGLNPIAVQHSGLLSALEELAANTRRIVDCTLECPEMLEVDDASALHLYRIAQEAVANAARHGGATRICIRLGFDGGHVVLSVRDNGSGKVRERIDGMGLSSMAYRAAALGGSFRVERNAGGGAKIVCRVPLDLIAGGSASRSSRDRIAPGASRPRRAGAPVNGGPAGLPV
jgi:signal transduction histidine kinase